VCNSAHYVIHVKIEAITITPGSDLVCASEKARLGFAIAGDDVMAEHVSMALPMRATCAAANHIGPVDHAALEDIAVFAAPAVFVALSASGFIGAKLGLCDAEPLTFLSLRIEIETDGQLTVGSRQCGSALRKRSLDACPGTG
jgi:hypothetical protein